MPLIKKILKLGLGLILLLFTLAIGLWAYIIFSIDPNDPCLSGDQLRYGDSISYGDTTYYLYFRTTGWHDKIIFYEVYNAKPIFDECDIADREPFHSYIFDENDEEIESKNHGKRLYIKDFILRLNPKDHEEIIKVVYTIDAAKGVTAYDVKFTGIEE